MGTLIFYLSHGSDVNHDWAASRTVEELDMIVSAVNDALRQAEEAMNQNLEGLTSGLNLPGFHF